MQLRTHLAAGLLLTAAAILAVVIAATIYGLMSGNASNAPTQLSWLSFNASPSTTSTTTASSTTTAASTSTIPTSTSSTTSSTSTASTSTVQPTTTSLSTTMSTSTTSITIPTTSSSTTSTVTTTVPAAQQPARKQMPALNFFPSPGMMLGTRAASPLGSFAYINRVKGIPSESVSVESWTRPSVANTPLQANSVSGGATANEIEAGILIINSSGMYSRTVNVSFYDSRAGTASVANYTPAGVLSPLLLDHSGLMNSVFVMTYNDAHGALTLINASADPPAGTTPLNMDVYSYISINSTINDSSVSAAEYYFAVNRSWLEYLGMQPQDIALYKYNNGSWAVLPTDIVGNTSSQYLFRSLSDSLSNYAVSFKTGNASSTSTTHLTLTMASGYTSYAFACATGGYAIPASGSSFSTTVVNGYYSSCGGDCSRAGYQTSPSAWCNQSTAWYETISGIGFNAIVPYGTIYSVANVTGGADTALSYNVIASNSFVVITGACGWYDCTIDVPPGCNLHDYSYVTGQDSSQDEICTQNPGTYSVKLTPSGTPGIGVLVAYVFAPYNVILYTNPTTANVETGNSVTYASGSTITTIGSSILDAVAPPTGTYQFEDWVQSNAANIIISNTLAQDTYVTIEGGGNIIANFNGITTFIEHGLPATTTWNVIYNGQTLSSSGNAITFSDAPGTYSFTIANQVVSGNTYLPTPSSGNELAGSTVLVTFALPGALTLAVQTNPVTYNVSDIVTATAPNPSDTTEVLIGVGTGKGSEVASGAGSATCNLYSTCSPPSNVPLPAGTYNLTGYDLTANTYTNSIAVTISKASPTLSLVVPSSFVYTGGGGSVTYSISTYNSQLSASLYVNNALAATTSSPTTQTYTTNSYPGTYSETFNTPGNANYTSASMSNSFTIYTGNYSVGFTYNSAAAAVAALVSVGLPGGYAGYYCEAGAFTRFSAAHPPISWTADINASTTSSPPNAISIGHQSTSTCTANAIGANGNPGLSVAGIALNQTRYQLTTGATGNSVTSGTFSFNVITSNSFALLMESSGGEEFGTGGVTTPANCIQQELLDSDYSGNPGAGTYIATCAKAPSGTYTTTAPLRSAGAIAFAAYVFPPSNVILDDNPATGNIMTSNNTYANGQSIQVVGRGVAFALPPPGNYIFMHWVASNSNITVSNSLARATFVNVAGSGTLTADWAISSTCTISLSPNSLSFGVVDPGATTHTNAAVTDINQGAVGAFMYVYGGNWTSGAANFGVSNTLWDAASQSSYTGTPLGLTPSNTNIPVAAAGSNSVYFGLGIPNGQGALTYNQIITIENVC